MQSQNIKTNMNPFYAQYGCGRSAPKEWTNFDVSPTLIIQKTPILGTILKSKLNFVFSSNVLYGDIIKGLPIDDNSCDGLYCSHTLEHISLQDFRKALKNSFKVLKKGGIFRCIVPDLEFAARSYIKDLDNGDKLSSLNFMINTLLGIKERPRGLKGFLTSFFGNSHHLWMWDYQSLSEELRNAGFLEIRACSFNDSEDGMFKHVEDAGRFENAVAIECRK
jgi:SAM-dependent methyltransferase